ncbi:MAG: phosphoglycolate phosphatase [Gammaproteobacteria bacterium]|nr:phosphoglycolate phosphatase [Gammaproteobacteria bacterium]
MIRPHSGGAAPAPPALDSATVVAFDLDGTLVDSAPDLAYCLGQALESLGFAAPSEADTRAWVGDGVNELARRALANARPLAGSAAQRPSPGSGDFETLVETTLDAFSRCYADNLFVRSRLYPGVVETLDALAARGVRLCCVTNKRIRFANALLEQADLLDRFELVIGGDSVPEKKPSPMPLDAAAERLGVAPSSAVFVGDSHQDLAAARAAGWRFVWVSYGYRQLSAAELGGAAAIDSLPELLDKLGAR